MVFFKCGAFASFVFFLHGANFSPRYFSSFLRCMATILPSPSGRDHRGDIITLVKKKERKEREKKRRKRIASYFPVPFRRRFNFIIEITK